MSPLNKFVFIICTSLVTGCGSGSEGVEPFVSENTGGEDSLATGGSVSENSGGMNNTGGTSNDTGGSSTGGRIIKQGPGGMVNTGGAVNTGGTVNTGGSVATTGGNVSTGGGPACVKKTCEEYAATVPTYGAGELTACGSIDDGCGGFLDCGNNCGGGAYPEYNSEYTKCGAAFSYKWDCPALSPDGFTCLAHPTNGFNFIDQIDFVKNRNICGSTCAEIREDSYNLCLTNKPDGPNTLPHMVTCESPASGMPRSNAPYGGCGPGHILSGQNKVEFFCCDH